MAYSRAKKTITLARAKTIQARLANCLADLGNYYMPSELINELGQSGLYSTWMPWLLRDIASFAAKNNADACDAIEQIAVGIATDWAGNKSPMAAQVKAKAICKAIEENAVDARSKTSDYYAAHAAWLATFGNHADFVRGTDLSVIDYALAAYEAANAFASRGDACKHIANQLLEMLRLDAPVIV